MNPTHIRMIGKINRANGVVRPDDLFLQHSGPGRDIPRDLKLPNDIADGDRVTVVVEFYTPKKD